MSALDAADNLRTIAHHWVEMSRWDKAEPAIRALLAVDPDDLDAHDMLSTTLLEKGEPSLAREVIERWLEIAPTDSRAHALLAFVEHAAANDEAAVAAATDAVRLAPNGAFERGVLAAVMLGAGDSAGAMHVALDALQLSPLEFNALRTLAWSSLENHRPDLAARATRDLLMLGPTHKFVLSSAGQLFRALGRRGEGMRLLRDLLANDPANPRCHLALGHAYWERGDAPAARQHFREALRLNPELEEVRKFLRMGRRTMPGNMPAGWRLYQQVITWDENGHKIVEEY